MRAYAAFFRKEMMESLRTGKCIVVLCIFFALGMMSPVTAKYLPDLLAAFLPEGMEMTLGEPTALDSWMQFFKNVPQIGLIVLVVLYCSLISGELSKGTLIPLRAKGLSWRKIILAKSSSAVLIWTISYGVAFGITWVYTWYFWKETWYDHLGLAVFGVWSFGVMLIQLLLLGGALFRTGSGSLLLTGGVVVISTLLQMLHPLADKMPTLLVSQPVGLMQGSSEISGYLIALGITWGIAAGSLIGSTCCVRNE